MIETTLFCGIPKGQNLAVGRDSGIPLKKWNHWFETDIAKALIAACERELNLEPGGISF